MSTDVHSILLVVRGEGVKLTCQQLLLLFYSLMSFGGGGSSGSGGFERRKERGKGLVLSLLFLNT